MRQQILLSDEVGHLPGEVVHGGIDQGYDQDLLIVSQQVANDQPSGQG
jgi:hypothetical protein